MDLNLFINIFKKEPGNIPPQAGSAQGRSGGEWQGKRQTVKDFIFCLIKVLFYSFQKNKKGQEILRIWHSQHHLFRRTQGPGFLFPPHFTASEDRAGQCQRQECYKQNRSPVIQLCVKLGLFYLLIFYTNASRFLTMKTQVKS